MSDKSRELAKATHTNAIDELLPCRIINVPHSFVQKTTRHCGRDLGQWTTVRQFRDPVRQDLVKVCVDCIL